MQLTPWFSLRNKPVRAGPYEISVSGVNANMDRLTAMQLQEVGSRQREDATIRTLVGYAWYSPATGTWTLENTDLVLMHHKRTRVWWRGVLK